jgi:hypothetical protein
VTDEPPLSADTGAADAVTTIPVRAGSCLVVSGIPTRTEFKSSQGYVRNILIILANFVAGGPGPGPHHREPSRNRGFLSLGGLMWDTCGNSRGTRQGEAVPDLLMSEVAGQIRTGR